MVKFQLGIAQQGVMLSFINLKVIILEGRESELVEQWFEMWHELFTNHVVLLYLVFVFA